MTTAGFGPPGTPGQADEPWGHQLGFWSRRWKPCPPGEKESDNPAAIGPAGNVHCSLADWARFAICHLQGERGDSPLSPKSSTTASIRPDGFRLIHCPSLGGNYAYGWVVEERDWAGGKVLTHGGSNTMWLSLIWLAPQRNLALLAATNLGSGAAFAACDAVVSRLIDFAERGS
jgi:D-alanyl-D-alanine carboxypeptidase